MNIIFLTLAGMESVEVRGIYPDLMRKFRDEGHHVYIVTPTERRNKKDTQLIEADGVHILRVKTFNVTKTHIIEKGVGTLLIERQFRKAIERYLGDVSFDLITYSTPPITFKDVVRYLKQRNPHAISYLQLKDIFPQNAVDIGMFGRKSLFNWYFRRKEKALYLVSDYIGCMSPANVAYIRDHNPEYPTDHVEVAPNSIELRSVPVQPGQLETERRYIRMKYNLPVDKPIFIYGGNLGKPQGIDYLMQCLNAVRRRNDCFFLVVGNGTEYHKLQMWHERNTAENIMLRSSLPKEDYDLLVKSCDVGLIFLDHRFTIPNYPSRLLSYLENKMPVICATDVNTDIGRIAEDNGYGFWCESVNTEDFVALVDKMLKADMKHMGMKGYEFLKQNYLIQNTYDVIMKHLK